MKIWSLEFILFIRFSGGHLGEGKEIRDGEIANVALILFNWTSWWIWGKGSVLVKELRAWNVPVLCVSQSYCALIICHLNRHVLHGAMFLLWSCMKLLCNLWNSLHRLLRSRSAPLLCFLPWTYDFFSLCSSHQLFSSKECWENIIKLSLRFIFCQDKVLGKHFHSQDKCYLHGLLIYNFFFFCPYCQWFRPDNTGNCFKCLQNVRKAECSSRAAAGVINIKFIRFFHFFVATMWALHICFISSQL